MYVLVLCCGGGVCADEEYSVKIDGVTSKLRRYVKRIIREDLKDFEAEKEVIYLYDASHKIKNLCIEEGYKDCSVASMWNEKERSVVFTIHTGRRFWVNKIELNGMAVFDPDDFLKKTGFRESGIVVKTYYSVLWLDDLKEAIKRNYEKKGYLGVRIDKLEQSFGEKGDVDIRVQIYEGQQYKISRIDIKGMRVFSREDLLAHLSGYDYYFPQCASEMKIDLQDFYYERGYVKMTSTSRIVDDGENEKAIIITVDEGRQYTISRVEIFGLTATRKFVIQGALEFREGDIYRESLVEETFRRLIRLNIFDYVNIEKTFTEDDQLVMNIILREAKNKRIQLYLGYGAYDMLRGGVLLEDRNIFGSGKTVAARFKGSMRGYRVEPRFEDPDLWGFRYQMLAYYEIQDELSFIRKKIGVESAFQRSFYKHYSIRMGYRFENRFAEDVEGNIINTRDSVKLSGPDLKFLADFRDDAIYPRLGALISLDFEETFLALGSEINYVKFETETSYFLPLPLNMVLAMSGRVSGLMPINEDREVPIQVKLFNGGSSTVRGFKHNYLGPLEDNKPVGGNARLVFNTELRMPLTPFTDRYRFAVLWDAGNLQEEFRDISVDGLIHSVGAGFRIRTPVGPIRLDYAHRLDKPFGWKTGRIHFSIGHAF